ncbi:integral membrane protein-like protein [Microdochium trichocladiopsis]|uniref:Integral membrane protein-like protein n=1 Tax=Microdochium trichocladiopsis TaxID=1682393 RepID=A0A9P9BUE4_9PEZI|nr:integral membrane protein-like protein [Microdochium trichocladiopsis]KAH7038037.1 integral membrane protein-like protein [Microdochium trichocladiopsis]
MAAKAMIPFLVGMMLLTGVCNTLLTKYQDNQCVRNCDDPDPKKRAHFEQPVLQTAQMFVGESGCWIVVGFMSLYQSYANKHKRDGYQAVSTRDPSAARDNDDDAASITSQDTLITRERRSGAPDGLLSGFGILLLALPAICDILGTTLMNAGLLMVAASIYQMTRGALVLFVGLFSVIFLKRKLHLFHWVSLFGVVLGVAVVGLAGYLYPDVKAQANALVADAADPGADALRAAFGVVLIAGAQIFTATQFVLEEFLLERSNIDPLQVVGWEGLFGLATTLTGMLVLHFAIGRTDAGRYGPFDMVEGLRQMTDNKVVLVSSLLIMVSIGGFNFFGLSVTRSVSATSRSTIDTCRTLFIWIVSLGLGWETFKWLQVLGFVLLVYFTFLFNGIVQPPFEFLRPREEPEALLPQEPIEHN